MRFVTKMAIMLAISITGGVGCDAPTNDMSNGNGGVEPPPANQVPPSPTPPGTTQPENQPNGTPGETDANDSQPGGTTPSPTLPLSDPPSDNP